MFAIIKDLMKDSFMKIKRTLNERVGSQFCALTFFSTLGNSRLKTQLSGRCLMALSVPSPLQSETNQENRRIAYTMTPGYESSLKELYICKTHCWGTHEINNCCPSSELMMLKKKKKKRFPPSLQELSSSLPPEFP